jgi:hypothetical protein
VRWLRCKGTTDRLTRQHPRLGFGVPEMVALTMTTRVSLSRNVKSDCPLLTLLAADTETCG